MLRQRHRSPFYKTLYHKHDSEAVTIGQCQCITLYAQEVSVSTNWKVCGSILGKVLPL